MKRCSRWKDDSPDFNGIATSCIVMTLIVQPSPVVFFLTCEASHFGGKNSLWRGIATTVSAKCGSSITPLTFPGVLLPLPSVSPSCCQAAYCYSGHACAKKQNFGGLFSTPTGLRRLGERHKPCEIRAAKISAGEEERRECFRFVLPLEKTGALNYS